MKNLTFLSENCMNQPQESKCMVVSSIGTFLSMREFPGGKSGSQFQPACRRQGFRFSVKRFCSNVRLEECGPGNVFPMNTSVVGSVFGVAPNPGLPPDDKCQGLPGAIYICTPAGVLKPRINIHCQGKF